MDRGCLPHMCIKRVLSNEDVSEAARMAALLLWLLHCVSMACRPAAGASATEPAVKRTSHICCAGLSVDGSRGAPLQVLLAAPAAAFGPGALDTLQRVVNVAELPCASATAQGGALGL